MAATQNRTRAVIRQLLGRLSPDALPTPPGDHPEVRRAAELVERASAELRRRREAFAAAQAKLAEQRAAAGRRLLDRIAAGDAEGEVEEPALTAASLPEGYVAEGEAALFQAQARYRAALANATEAFRVEMVPVLMDAITDAGEAVKAAVAANGRLAGLLRYGEEHGAPPPAAAYELLFARLPADPGDVDGEVEARKRHFLPKPGRRNHMIALRIRTPFSRYGEGETVGFDAETARDLVLSGLAETTDPDDAKRLGTTSVLHFDGPQRVRLRADFHGADPVRFAKAGAIVTVGATEAAALVNTGKAEHLGAVS